MTLIKESHNLSKLSTNILIGKLLTHELILRQREEEQQSKNKKGLALKALQESSDESKFNEYDEEMTSFIKYLIKKNLSNHKESKRRGFKKTKEVICFKCKRPVHIQDEFPKLKHREAKDKRRAFKATWNDLSEFEMEEEQEDKENKKCLAFKASQDLSDESELEDSSEDDEEIASFTKYFMEYLRKKNLSKHKESKRGGLKKANEAIYFKCKRPDHT